MSTMSNQSAGPISRYQNNTVTSPSCQEKTLDKEAIREKTPLITIYPHCIVYRPKARFRPFQPHRTSKRGRISDFTRRSRFRLFALLAKISGNPKFQPIFVTLTYHYGHINAPQSTKSQLHNFLVQLRNYDPDFQYIWRVELQKRGAPHYHMIIFPSSSCGSSGTPAYQLEISRIWHSIADPNSRRHKDFGCKIKVITSYKMACAYVSKYVAKVSNDIPDDHQGKHWANSMNVPIEVCSTIELNEQGSRHAIEKIRRWLLKHGKDKQAQYEYLNVYREQTVFISPDEFDTVFYENPVPQ